MGSVKRIFSFVLALLALPLFSLRGKAEIIRKGETGEKKIALTFDDGPSKQNTKEILDILDSFGIRATFFVIGQNAAKDPERVKSIYDAGHELGNHTYTHAYISKISKEVLREEISKTEEILMEVTGEKPRVFRPPGGFYNDEALSLLEEMGYQSVLWSLDTRDWSLPKSEKIVSKIEGGTGCGEIILFHDLEDKRLPTPEVLKKIIPFLLENGYEFVTVSELLQEEE